MTRRLRAYVHVHMPSGQTVVVGPDDTVPDDVAALIQNPAAWDEAPEPTVVPVPAPPGSDTDDPDVEPGADDLDDDEPVSHEPAEPERAAEPAPISLPVPPRAGAGSGTTAWAAYARAHGVDVGDDAGRADILAALTAAGVPVE